MISPDAHERLMAEDINYKVKYLENQIAISERYYEAAFEMLCDELGHMDPGDISAMINKAVMSKDGGNFLFQF